MSLIMIWMIPMINVSLVMNFAVKVELNKENRYSQQNSVGDYWE
jgi:hypothetical protein